MGSTGDSECRTVQWWSLRTETLVRRDLWPGGTLGTLWFGGVTGARVTSSPAWPTMRPWALPKWCAGPTCCFRPRARFCLTDAPVEDVSPLASFYASVSRKLKDGTVFY